MSVRRSRRFIQDVHHVHHRITHVPGGSLRLNRGSLPLLRSHNSHLREYDLRKGAFGKNDGHNLLGAQRFNPGGTPREQRRSRITGSYGQNPLSKKAVINSFQIPLILIAPMCLGMYCLYLRGVAR
ncbi:hypothetical protein BDM02DRAFT_3114900 [Thelephora ganbajun]|uniref:Uncharacterized protein n=1 Tax=Thelephora ganbajun TaxID=370292 RepID=A0ACB6ZG01_THEGA|nr:hypothetical protein BDM02DRAFT_3114900 [Thelephora ganbajun]